MKLFNNELVFDAIPSQVTKVFFTSMIFMPKSLPKWLPTIYTTKHLAAQLTFYLNSNGIKQCTEENFVLLKPFEPTPLRLSSGDELEIFACESEDIDRSMMILIRKDNKTIHLYGGICTDLRSAFLNDTFIAWISDGVENLYIDLNKCSSEENYTLRYTNAAIDRIEAILDNDRTIKINLVVPLFGTNAFIARLAWRLRARVGLTGQLASNYSHLYGDDGNMTHFQACPNKAKIIVTNLEPSEEIMKYSHDIFKCLTIKLSENADSNRNKHFYQELLWSSRPTPYELRAIVELVQPLHIYSILRKVPVPTYLQNLCRRTPTAKVASTAKAPVKQLIHVKLPSKNQKSPEAVAAAAPAAAASCSQQITTPKQSREQQLSKAEKLQSQTVLSPILCRHKQQLRYLEESEPDV